MKRKLRWIYTITTPDGTQWVGDCVRWFTDRLGHDPATTYERTRVVWVGATWSCPGCIHGAH